MRKKLIFLVIMLILALGLGIWSVQAGEETAIFQQVKLPEDMKIVPPSNHLPLEIAALSGRWEGKWGDQLPAVLIVEEITDSKIKAIYAWGATPYFPSDFTRFESKVSRKKNGKCKIYYRKAMGSVWFSVAFLFNFNQDDNTLAGKYRNSYGAYSKITMHRVDMHRAEK